LSLHYPKEDRMGAKEIRLFQSIFDELRLIKTEMRLQRNHYKEELQRPIEALELSMVDSFLDRLEKRLYRQVEALTSLYSTLDIQVPFPPMRGWAVSPDFASLLVQEIFLKRPDTILELGSGVSTLVAAYALSKLGEGRLLSFDHDQSFCMATEKNIKVHSLESVAQVHYAPICDIMLVGPEKL